MNNEELNNEELNNEIINFGIILGKGNPGALIVLGEIIKKYYNNSYNIFNKINEKNLNGDKIWIKYKDLDKNIEKFVKEILES